MPRFQAFRRLPLGVMIAAFLVGLPPDANAQSRTTGRTYVATTVALPSLQLSAVRAAIVMAVGGGADGLEAVAVVSGSDKPPQAEDLAAVRDLGGPTTPVYLASADGGVWARIDAG